MSGRRAFQAISKRGWAVERWKTARESFGGGSSHGSGTERENRIALRFTIEVCGFDRFGKFFSERSETANVSRHGCKFTIRTEIAPEAVVAIRVVRAKSPGSPSAPSLFQVARTEPAHDGWRAGAAMLQADDLWAVDFAALDNDRQTGN
jgi:hypothetical protein